MAIEQKGIRTKYEAASSDDAVKIAIADHECHVMIFFNKRISWFELPKLAMVDLACSLLRRAGAKFTVEMEDK